MRQGTTATQTFTLPISVELIKTVEVTYAHGEKIVLQKYNDDVEMTDNRVVVHLKQEDTFKFDWKQPLRVQLRIYLTDGSVPEMPIFTFNVAESLSREVLV